VRVRTIDVKIYRWNLFTRDRCNSGKRAIGWA